MFTLTEEVGYIFVYLFVFGINSYIVKNWCKTDELYIMYYIIIGILAMIIFNNIKK